jgi:hypothetical protein
MAYIVVTSKERKNIIYLSVDYVTTFSVTRIPNIMDE